MTTCIFRLDVSAVSSAERRTSGATPSTFSVTLMFSDTKCPASSVTVTM